MLIRRTNALAVCTGETAARCPDHQSRRQRACTAPANDQKAEVAPISSWLPMLRRTRDRGNYAHCCCSDLEQQRPESVDIQLCVPNGATPEDWPLGEAEARSAVVRLIDSLRDVATPAGPRPQTHPADRPPSCSWCPPTPSERARAMLTDLGLLLRALGEQRLYRQAETLSSRAAIRSLTRPFAA